MSSYQLSTPTPYRDDRPLLDLVLAYHFTIRFSICTSEGFRTTFDVAMLTTDCIFNTSVRSFIASVHFNITLDEMRFSYAVFP